MQYDYGLFCSTLLYVRADFLEHILQGSPHEHKIVVPCENKSHAYLYILYQVNTAFLL